MGGRSGDVGRKPRQRQQPPIMPVVLRKNPQGYPSRQDLIDYKTQVENQKNQMAQQPEAERGDWENWLPQNTKRQAITKVRGTVDHWLQDYSEPRTPTKHTGKIDPSQQHINPPVEDYLATLTKNEHRESAALLDARTGDLLGGVVVGASKSVSIDRDIYSPDGQRNMILTHTHPSSGSFSPDDISMLEYSEGLAAIRAVGTNTINGVDQPYIYTMQKAPGGSYDELGDWNNIRGSVESAWLKERAKHQLYYEIKVGSREMHNDEAWIEHSHKINKEVAQQRNLIYTRIEPSGRVEKQYPSGRVEVIEPGQFSDSAESNIDEGQLSRSGKENADEISR